VEKPHLREVSGGLAEVIVHDPTENIPTTNDTVLGMGKWNRGLLGESLMRTSSVVVVGIFLEYSHEMAVVEGEQLIKAVGAT
jgi:hypothetical protein